MQNDRGRANRSGRNGERGTGNGRVKCSDGGDEGCGGG